MGSMNWAAHARLARLLPAFGVGLVRGLLAAFGFAFARGLLFGFAFARAGGATTAAAGAGGFGSARKIGKHSLRAAWLAAMSRPLRALRPGDAASRWPFVISWTKNHAVAMTLINKPSHKS